MLLETTQGPSPGAHGPHSTGHCCGSPASVLVSFAAFRHKPSQPTHECAHRFRESPLLSRPLTLAELLTVYLFGIGFDVDLANEVIMFVLKQRAKARGEVV